MSEALPQLEAVERERGIDFGEMVRERRRPRGLSLPIADKVLPFRVKPTEDPAEEPSPLHVGDLALNAGNIKDADLARAAAADARVTEAWGRLAAAAVSRGGSWRNWRWRFKPR